MSFVEGSIYLEITHIAKRGTHPERSDDKPDEPWYKNGSSPKLRTGERKMVDPLHVGSGPLPAMAKRERTKFQLGEKSLSLIKKHLKSSRPLLRGKRL